MFLIQDYEGVIPRHIEEPGIPAAVAAQYHHVVVTILEQSLTKAVGDL
jgi:hypothetical protein